MGLISSIVDGLVQALAKDFSTFLAHNPFSRVSKSVRPTHVTELRFLNFTNSHFKQQIMSYK